MKFSWGRCVYLVAILLAIGFGIYTLRGSQGIPALMKKRAEIKDLEKGNADLAREIEKKRARIKRLENNPAEQELEIRRQLRLVHPGERVYQDQDKKPQ
jgi:cell division protein FtsB